MRAELWPCESCKRYRVRKAALPPVAFRCDCGASYDANYRLVETGRPDPLQEKNTSAAARATTGRR